MKFEEIKKHVPNLKSVEKKLKEFTFKLENAKDGKETIKVIKSYFKYSDSLESDITVINIRNSINTKDKEYDKAMNKLNEILPVINGYDTSFKKAIVNSSFKGDIEKAFGSHYMKMVENQLKVFDEKAIPLMIEENKLVTEYEKLLASAELDFKGEKMNLSQIGKYLSDKDRNVRIEAAKLSYGFLEENDAKFGEIYDKLVHVRDKIAKTLGFSSYIEYRYLALGRMDYNEEMVAGYREQIHKDVVPVVAKLRKRQAKRLGIKKPNFLDYNLDYNSGNAEPLGNSAFLVKKASEMYHDMSKESGEFFDFMVDSHLLDLDAKPGKMGGGYMTYIPKYKAPFIFANSNGSSQDVDTLTHEVGHAFQGYLGSKIKVPAERMPTLEACEIDSMSMEFFAWPYMESFFGENANKYRFSHLDGAISFLPYGVEVDEFQHWVFHNVDATHEERCAKWAEIDKKYRPWMDYSPVPYLSKGKIWIRQHHIFSSPFYYIDYTLAQVLALQFKCEMDKNKEKAWKKYIKLLKMGGKYPFIELISKAGLRNPFIDGNVRKVIKPQVKVLNSFDDMSY